MQKTRLEGAATHNLKTIDLELEPGELVAVTGVTIYQMLHVNQC